MSPASCYSHFTGCTFFWLSFLCQFFLLCFRFWNFSFSCLIRDSVLWQISFDFTHKENLTKYTSIVERNCRGDAIIGRSVMMFFSLPNSCFLSVGNSRVKFPTFIKCSIEFQKYQKDFCLECVEGQAEEPKGDGSGANA